MAQGRGAQHAGLPEAVHEPALRHGPQRVGEAEGAHHASGHGERARRVVGEQQDPQAEHADRHRTGGRQDHRRAGARQREQRPIAPRALPRVRQDAHAPPRYRPGPSRRSGAPAQADALEHVGDVLARVDARLERLEDVLPADHDHRVDAVGEQRRDAVAADAGRPRSPGGGSRRGAARGRRRCAGSAAPARPARRRRRARRPARPPAPSAPRRRRAPSLSAACSAKSTMSSSAVASS